jgi:hypothetical protein
MNHLGEFVGESFSGLASMAYALLAIGLIFWVIPMALGLFIDKIKGDTAPMADPAVHGYPELTVFQKVLFICSLIVGIGLLGFAILAFFYLGRVVGSLVIGGVGYVVMQYSWRRLRYLPIPQRNFGRFRW